MLLMDGPALRALAADTGLELVWATTWTHLANELVAPAIGLPPLPVVEFPDYGDGWRPDGSGTAEHLDDVRAWAAGL